MTAVTELKRAGDEPTGRIALAVGPPMALAVAGLLEQVRDNIGVANVALALSFVVVVAAISGRAAGLTTAVTAGLAYNFFHTRPYYSLRISSGRDIATVILLMLVGVVVSEISAWRRRAQAASVRQLRGARALESTAAQLAAGAQPDEIWSGIRAALIDSLELSDCRYEPGGSPSVPALPRTGSLLAGRMQLGRHGFELPTTGAAVEVVYAGQTLGHIVLTPQGHAGSTRDDRRIAVALADQFAVALATSGRHGGM